MERGGRERGMDREEAGMDDGEKEGEGERDQLTVFSTEMNSTQVFIN